MSKFHIFDSRQIVGKFDSGIPVASMCGKIKKLKSKRHDKFLAEGAPVCEDCQRILDAHIKTGQANLLPSRTAADVNAGVGVYPQAWSGWTFTFDTTPTKTRPGFPLAA